MIGDRIRWLRSRHNMTQADLAEFLDMSETQVLRWENGKFQPNIDAVVKLAKHFGVTSDYLLGLADDPRGNMATELSQLEWDMIQALRQSSWTAFNEYLLANLKARDKTP